MPVLKFDCAGPGVVATPHVRKDMMDDMAELRGRCEERETYDRRVVPGMGIHEMGTADGKDPKTSVLNAHNQVWDAPKCSSRMVRAWCRRRA